MVYCIRNTKAPTRLRCCWVFPFANALCQGIPTHPRLNHKRQFIIWHGCGKINKIYNLLVWKIFSYSNGSKQFPLKGTHLQYTSKYSWNIPNTEQQKSTNKWLIVIWCLNTFVQWLNQPLSFYKARLKFLFSSQISKIDLRYSSYLGSQTAFFSN